MNGAGNIYQFTLHCTSDQTPSQQLRCSAAASVRIQPFENPSRLVLKDSFN
jgi:hypothetical protein